jgi:hypothetical protein
MCAQKWLCLCIQKHVPKDTRCNRITIMCKHKDDNCSRISKTCTQRWLCLHILKHVHKDNVSVNHIYPNACTLSVSVQYNIKMVLQSHYKSTCRKEGAAVALLKHMQKRGSCSRITKAHAEKRELQSHY